MLDRMPKVKKDDRTLEFIECVQASPCLWDKSHDDYKDKTKVEDAWNAIVDNFDFLDGNFLIYFFK